MKVRAVTPAALALAVPVLMIIALLMPLACGSSGSSSAAATPQPTKGNIEIGLVSNPPAGFQSILLNLVSVRFNTASNATDANTGWVVVPVPSGVGGPCCGPIVTDTSGGGSFFNTSNPETNPGPSELQVDLYNLANNVQLFNAAGVPAQTYHTVQLKVDANIPGNIQPNCAKAPNPGAEGCINYPAALSSLSTLTFSTPIPVKKNVLTTVVLNVDPGTIVPPNKSGGSYTISPVISVVPNSATSPVPISPLMALLSGTVTGGQGKKVKVVAELAGTNDMIAEVKVKGGSYSIQLPASQDGTSYDLFAFGNGTSFDVIPASAPSPIVQPLQRGLSYNVDFTVKSKATHTLSGTVSDACSAGHAIQSATVDLLASPTAAGDCANLPTPADCVVIASTSTSVTGKYPTAGRTGMPQSFNHLPTAPDGTYALRISASGFDTLTSPVFNSGGAITCNAGQKCNFALTRSTINGTVTVPPAPGTTQVQVFAEVTGTNDIVSALSAPVSIPCPGPNPCSQAFSLNVPTSPGTYDLYATTIDLYNGAPDPFTGHLYQVAQGVVAAPQCQIVSQDLDELVCAGHGSISGNVTTFDTTTTVRLFKGGVQVEQSPVGIGTNNAGAYNFCAPADDYQVQRWEGDAPGGPAVDVTVPAPNPTASPCALCTNNDGTCPGNCSDTSGPTL